VNAHRVIEPVWSNRSVSATIHGEDGVRLRQVSSRFSE
jgi:hypothetical protein